MTITDLFLACKNLDTDNIFHIYRRKFTAYGARDEYFGSFTYNDMTDSMAEAVVIEFEFLNNGSVKVYIEA